MLMLMLVVWWLMFPVARGAANLGGATNQLAPFENNPSLLFRVQFFHLELDDLSIIHIRPRAHDARPRQQRPCRRTIMDSPPDARRPGRLHRHADP